MNQGVFQNPVFVVMCPCSPVCRPKVTNVLPLRKNRAFLLSLLAQIYHCQILLTPFERNSFQNSLFSWHATRALSCMFFVSCARRTK